MSDHERLYSKWANNLATVLFDEFGISESKQAMEAKNALVEALVDTLVDWEADYSIDQMDDEDEDEDEIDPADDAGSADAPSKE